MSFTTIVMTDWDTDDIPTAGQIKTQILDNLNYLNSAVSVQITITAAGLKPTLTDGCAAPTQIETTTYKGNFLVLDFDGTTAEYAQCTIPAMPSDWDGGTLTAKFIWTANDATTHAVVWGVYLFSIDDDEALDAAFSSVLTVTDANGGAAYTKRISAATAAITPAGTPAAGELLQVCVGRFPADAADTMTGVDARLIGVVFNYTRI